jgi:leucyl aminopeptidase
MQEKGSTPIAAGLEHVFAAGPRHDADVPIHLVGEGNDLGAFGDPAQRRWINTVRFKSTAKKQALVPDGEGGVSAVLLGTGNGAAGEPCGPSALLAGQLASSLPPGTYRLSEDSGGNGELTALAWGLGAYRFRRYKSNGGGEAARLRIPDGVDAMRLSHMVEAIWLGRDLINTPASDMGPDELEDAARQLAARFGARISVITGMALLEQNFPMIHAVGRASPRAPRLIDLSWSKAGGRSDAPRVTLVGKGICFDTGGLDLKPASNMILMKKDMGGAATALTLGHLIMGTGLDVRLRILIPAAENSVAGNAFRPSDVLQSRGGHSVEVGNTDAEGRLVLADAIALADEEAPDSILVFATLTGAARVALGPDLPALFTDDDAFAASVTQHGLEIGDPLWRMPLWRGYDRHLDSDVADMNNVYESPFAGAVTAALFLRRFCRQARRFAHFDLFGWRPAARPLGPKGGEPQTARAVFAALEAEAAQS